MIRCSQWGVVFTVVKRCLSNMLFIYPIMWPTCWKLSWLSVKCSSSCFSLELFKDVWLPSNSEQARVGLKAEIVLSVNSGLLDFRKSWSGECDSTCRYLDKEEEEQVEMWLLQWFQLSGVCVRCLWWPEPTSPVTAKRSHRVHSAVSALTCSLC